LLRSDVEVVDVGEGNHAERRLKLLHLLKPLVEMLAESEGTLHVKVVAHDFIVWDGDAAILEATDPFATIDTHEVDDDHEGESNGNSDGVVNAGESIEFRVALTNAGGATATAVEATLSSPSPYVIVPDADETYGDIGPGESRWCLDDFDLTIDSETPDGEIILLSLAIEADGGTYQWESSIEQSVSSPVLEISALGVDDSEDGNGNGCVEPGEIVTMTLEITNSGSAAAEDVLALIDCADPYIDITVHSAGATTIASGASVVLTPDYSVTVLPGCLSTHAVVFGADITAEWGYSSSSEFEMPSPGGRFADDMESGEGRWTHRSATAGHIEQWHIDTSRSHSGSSSWKLGGEGTTHYACYIDGALETQVLCLAVDSGLSFWHWLAAEEESATDAIDGCLVEISSGPDWAWTALTPSGGYSHTLLYDVTNSLPTNTRGWSGSHDWRSETLDIPSEYEGVPARLRFRFASGSFTTDEGWYIDDIVIDGAKSDSPPDDGWPTRLALRQNAPNPFNPSTRIAYELPERGRVRIDIYDISGRHVKTLVDGEEDAGFKTTEWDGTNKSGLGVASGVYVYRVCVGDAVSERRMVLLK